MQPATATFIRELIRQAKGALAACEKWIVAVEDRPLPDTQEARPELHQ